MAWRGTLLNGEEGAMMGMWRAGNVCSLDPLPRRPRAAGLSTPCQNKHGKRGIWAGGKKRGKQLTLDSGSFVVNGADRSLPGGSSLSALPEIAQTVVLPPSLLAPSIRTVCRSSFRRFWSCTGVSHKCHISILSILKKTLYFGNSSPSALKAEVPSSASQPPVA